jgi:apolipoprotein D and lipocalin family protein
MGGVIMKQLGIRLGLSLGLTALIFCQHAEAVIPLPEPVSYVDLESFAGKWYEIAAIPKFAERNCMSDTTVEYSVLSDGRIGILHACNGGNRQVEGRAEVTDPVSHAKLRATFVDALGWRFIAARDYWILYVDPDYQYAIIGHPSHEYGWILSRTPCISKETLHILTCKLKEQGYNPCQFRLIPQAGGLQTNQELCSYLQSGS